MAAIELPSDYFGNRPPVFGPLVQGFSDALGDVHSDVARTLDAWTNGTHPDTLASLSGVDADDGRIADVVAGEHTAIITTPTGDALARYGTGDALASTADRSKAPQYLAPPGVIVGPPPDVPIDVQQPAGVDTQGFVAPSVPALDVTTVQAPDASATLPQDTTSLAQPGTESPLPLAASTPAEAPPEAILASAQPVQAVDVPAVPSPAAPFVTRDELVELLGQLEATIIVMT